MKTLRTAIDEILELDKHVATATISMPDNPLGRYLAGMPQAVQVIKELEEKLRVAREALFFAAAGNDELVNKIAVEAINKTNMEEI